jgi:hypothetical protein
MVMQHFKEPVDIDVRILSVRVQDFGNPKLRFVSKCAPIPIFSCFGRHRWRTITQELSGAIAWTTFVRIAY